MVSSLAIPPICQRLRASFLSHDKKAHCQATSVREMELTRIDGRSKATWTRETVNELDKGRCLCLVCWLSKRWTK